MFLTALSKMFQIFGSKKMGAEVEKGILWMKASVWLPTSMVLSWQRAQRVESTESCTQMAGRHSVSSTSHAASWRTEF